MMRFFPAYVTVLVTLLLLYEGRSLVESAREHADLISKKATPIVYDRNGSFLTQIGDVFVSAEGKREVEYGYWPLERAPERVILTTLALEDRRYFSHSGVDYRAILRAAWNNLTQSRRIEGASTVAMQVARMQSDGGRNLINKSREALQALAIIAKNGHEKTLLHYLQIAPYGNGSHGVGHAARYYFDRPVQDLSWAQSAILAAIPQSPSRMNITRESGLRRAVSRADYAIDVLEHNGSIDTFQAQLAHKELASMRPFDKKHRPESLHLALRYEKYVQENGSTEFSKYDPRIDATIDLATEDDITKISRKYLSYYRNSGARQVAVMVLERGTNSVLADVGSSDYYNQNAGSFDYTRVSRSPGSTLKPFIYALALERGIIETTDLLNDIPEGASGISNSDGEYLGPITPRQALANSRNVPATNLLRRVGLDANFQFLQELRLHDIHRSADAFGVSMAIGALPSKLEYLMRGYAALADDGVMSELRFTRQQMQSQGHRVMSVDTARLITSFLSDAQARLPTFSRYGAMEYPFAVAVKTGTSQNYRDAWTMAYSQKYVVGVWLGRADAGAMRSLTGASSAARLAHDVFAYLHKAKVEERFPEEFPPPPDRVLIDLCHDDVNELCGHAMKEWVKPAILHSVAQLKTASAARYIQDNQFNKLLIAVPENETHIWRNPNQPEKFNNIPLKLSPVGAVGQILWIIDGEPFKTAQADETVYWPMSVGRHHIQARAAMAPIFSQRIVITVE
jgi:penicillin-binding protein 1C